MFLKLDLDGTEDDETAENKKHNQRILDEAQAERDAASQEWYRKELQVVTQDEPAPDVFVDIEGTTFKVLWQYTDPEDEV